MEANAKIHSQVQGQVSGVQLKRGKRGSVRWGIKIILRKHTEKADPSSWELRDSKTDTKGDRMGPN